MNQSVFPHSTKSTPAIIGILLIAVCIFATLPGIAGATTFAFKPNEYANPNKTTSLGTIPSSSSPMFGFHAWDGTRAGFISDANGWASLPNMNWAPGVPTVYSTFRAFNYSASDWMIEGFDVRNTGSSTIQITVTSTLKSSATVVDTFNIAPGTQTISLAGHGPIAGSGSSMTAITFSPTIDLSFNNFQLAVYSAPVPATVSTNSASDITETTATSGGNVTSAGSGTVTARGVCWSTSPNPTISNSKTVDGTGTGSFTSSLTGLNPNTTYHVRAYATTSAGTSYGTDLTFTTEKTVSYTPASSPWSLALLVLTGLGGVIVLNRRASPKG